MYLFPELLLLFELQQVRCNGENVPKACHSPADSASSGHFGQDNYYFCTFEDSPVSNKYDYFKSLFQGCKFCMVIVCLPLD